MTPSRCSPTPRHCAILYVLITALGPISGAHINPAVSAVFALRREIAPAVALAYAAVQIAGGIAGTFLAHAMFAEPLIQLSAHARTGGAQCLSEAVATFALVFTILMTTRTRPEAVPMAVALVITAGYWFTASTSFANPAVTVARALTDSFSGIAPADVLPFVAAQMAGALIGWLAARWLAPPCSASPARST